MIRRGAVALAVVLAAPVAGAVSFGEVQVRSYLGEKLDARIAVSPAAGESIRGACFSLAREGAPGVPRLTDAELTLQRSASGTFLRIRSASPVEDPALALGIFVECPGQQPQGTQEFSILVDPRTRAAPPTVAASGADAPLPASTRLGAREGDTLESIATAIFPRDRTARSSYLEALREANASLAARGDHEPIAANETVVLPDLRTFMQQRRSARSETAKAPAREAPSASAELAAPPPAAPAPRRAAAPAPAPAPAPQAAPATEAATPLNEAAAPAPRSAPAKAAAPAPATSRGRTIPGFQLKLSGVEVDLTRSSAIDDRSRAQLRERLLMLDADDQVAAMLSLRNSLKQLEARVAELQLKLAGMPPSLAGKAETAAAVPAPARVEPAAPPAPAPVIAAAPKAAPPPVVEPPKVEAAPPAPEPKAEPPAPAPAPKVDAAPAPTPKPEASAPAATSAPADAAKPAPPESRAPRAIPRPAVPESSLPSWLWAVVALFAVLALLLAWYIVRRRREPRDEFYSDDEVALPTDPLDEIAPEAGPASGEPEIEAAFQASEPEHRGVIASDSELTTRIPQEDAEDLRRRYIEERFPEITTRMIVLDDADSVVKGARLFYEDGALPRAVELLQFAIEAHPEEMKSWLALFEIFRLERLTGEFAALAERFKQQHGTTENWRKVQFFGRDIDPGNALYQGAPLDTLATIGPREARRIAAAASFDPIAENWLNSPMDFQDEVLANELRTVLMQHAGLTDQDLQPNAMPALRNVEMFTVA